MGRIAGRPSDGINAVLLLIVGLVAASGPMRGIADEPKPKEKAEAKPGASKAKGSASKKADEAKAKGPMTEEEFKAERKARLKDVAFKAAEAYIVQLDKGKYGEAWETMAEEVRKGITRRKWVDLLGKTRTPHGKILGRKLRKIDMRDTEVAERWDEAWIYDDFRTEDGETASELIVVVLEKGKNWVVSGYYIGDPATFPKPPAKEEEPTKAAPK